MELVVNPKGGIGHSPSAAAIAQANREWAILHADDVPKMVDVDEPERDDWIGRRIRQILVDNDTAH